MYGILSCWLPLPKYTTKRPSVGTKLRYIVKMESASRKFLKSEYGSMETAKFAALSFYDKASLFKAQFHTRKGKVPNGKTQGLLI